MRKEQILRMCVKQSSARHSPTLSIIFRQKKLSWLLLAVCPALWLSLPGVALGQTSKPDSGCYGDGVNFVKISCDYAISPLKVSTGDTPEIVLNRLFLSFKTLDENYLQVELTFINQSKTPVSSARRVYMAFDNDAGHNLVRRVLTHVDLRKLPQDTPVKFSDRLLIGVIPPGHYSVHLWIPSADVSAESDVSQNLLLSNAGVADRQTGLNTIATFSIIH